MRAVDFLTPIGLALAFGVQWAERQGKELPGETWYYFAGAALLVLLHLALRWPAIAAAVGGRQLKYGSNTFLLSLAVLSILGGLNYYVYRHTQRWDLTKNQRFSLADQTRKVVASLEEEVQITYFQRETETLGAQDRLKEYQVLSPRIKVEYVDPWKQPGKANEYDITSVPTLVVEMAGRRERVTSDSEQDVTNALIKVSREETKTVCFAAGEGERDPDDSSDSGYSAARAALTRSQYAIDKVVLLREKAVPEKCTVFVLAGPEHDLLPEATAALERYVAAGGKLLVMEDAPIDKPRPNVAALLAGWNLKPGDNVVVDVSGVGQFFGTGPITPIVLEYPWHEITKDMRGVMSAFHTARSLEAGSETQEGLNAQNLLLTSEASWAESDLSLKQPVRIDEGAGDAPGPVTLGAVVTLRVDGEPPTEATAAPEGEAEEPDAAEGDAPAEAPRKEGRVVAIGDSDFASNALLAFQGNQDLFLNIVAWLAEDVELISIRPKEPEDQRMVLTQQQQRYVSYLALFVLPGFFVLLGIANWWRRRG